MGLHRESLEGRTLKYAYDHVFGKAHALGVDALTENERAFHTVYFADTHICGGSIYRVFNDFPELLENLDEAYARLHMPKKADALKSILGLLPAPMPLWEERLEQIMEIQEDKPALDNEIQKIELTFYSNSREDVDEHLYRFVIEHRAEFLQEE